MQHVKLCLDYKDYSQKPKDIETAQIAARIATRTFHLNSENIKKLIGDVSLDGHTFCPATFKNGKKSRENFEQMQLFVLDFDNDKPGKIISFDGVKERADRYQLPVLFSYETFTSKNKDKFRVVFLNDAPVSEIRDAEVIQNAIMAIFPEADPACKSVVQMYFGGRKDSTLFFDKSIPKINIFSAISGMTKYLEDQHGKNYRRKVSEFIRENKLATNERVMPDVSILDDVSALVKNAEIHGASPNEKNSPNSIIYNNTSIVEGFGEKFSNKNYLINMMMAPVTLRKSYCQEIMPITDRQF
jgi:hypothetical protein